jgi:hypothetical protein
MVSADRYEGTRTAQLPDWIHIKDILAPLAEEGVLVKKNDDDLKREVSLGNFSVTERDGKIIACAALRRYELRTRGKLGQRFTTSVETGDENLLTDSRTETVEIVAEIGAFAVKPGYRERRKGRRASFVLGKNSHGKVRPWSFHRISASAFARTRLAKGRLTSALTVCPHGAIYSSCEGTSYLCPDCLSTRRDILVLRRDVLPLP